MEHVEASMDAGPVVHDSIGIGATQQNINNWLGHV
jgi:hypothetical protein